MTVRLETASVAVTGSGFAATIATSLHGQATTATVTPDSSPAGFTATSTMTTPGGSVTLVSGGTNSYDRLGTRFGQSNVHVGDWTISASTDPSLTTSHYGSFELFGKSAGLQYTSFGVWSLNPCVITADCQPIYAGALAGSQEGASQTASMPTTGSATYSGGATGYVVQPTAVNANNVGGFYGASSLTANFATNAITGSVTGLQVYEVNNGTLIGTMNNIGLSATISGSNYSGTANVTGSAGTAFNIAGATGSMAGSFYGPAADETAGVFYLSGGANSTSVLGSFGAKQAAPSDRRLKLDVEVAGSLPGGLMLHTWRYMGGSHRFTGVMAQDLLANPAFADAVLLDDDGLMRVDYARIGYQPADYALMVEQGERAVALYRQSTH